MTVLIVAILGGRTKDEWYSWITDRVKQKYGYETPITLPRLYEENRLASFKARQEDRKEREAAEKERNRRGDRDDAVNSSARSSAVSVIAA